jgi:hypothetical protein
MMVHRDAAGVRLLTRRGNDWSDRYPLIAAAVGALRVRSCLIDGEAVACGDDGLPAFDRLRYRRQDAAVFLFAFDLLDARWGRSATRAIRDAQGDCYLIVTTKVATFQLELFRSRANPTHRVMLTPSEGILRYASGGAPTRYCPCAKMVSLARRRDSKRG